MSMQYHVLARTLLINSITIISIAILTACTQVDERVYPKGHYDNYYGTLPKKVAPHTKKKIEIKATAPQKYVVQKGDTLWGISQKFLVKPWYWPEIWDKNQKIKNPHLIYPGDVLYLTFVHDNNGKLVPRIRVDRGNQHQPVSTLIPFLAWSKVLDQDTIDKAPYIVASRDDHNLIVEGERVYIKNLHAQKGDRFAIFHQQKELIDPETKRSLGFEVDYVGYARIERQDNLSTAFIISAKREIRRGDHLFKPVDEVRGLNIPIHEPNFKVRGTVISLYDAHAISGQYMIAVINRGKRQHIEVGHTLGIYTNGRTIIDNKEKAHAQQAIKQYRKEHPEAYFKKQIDELPSYDVEVELPPERIATLVIYKVTDNVSFGLIVDSERAVRNGDIIGNP